MRLEYLMSRSPSRNSSRCRCAPALLVHRKSIENDDPIKCHYIKETSGSRNRRQIDVCNIKLESTKNLLGTTEEEGKKEKSLRYREHSSATMKKIEGGGIQSG